MNTFLDPVTGLAYVQPILTDSLSVTRTFAAAFQETFESLVAGELNGQNGWVRGTATVPLLNVTIGSLVNGINCVTGTNGGVGVFADYHKALATAIPAASGYTVEFCWHGAVGGAHSSQAGITLWDGVPDYVTYAGISLGVTVLVPSHAAGPANAAGILVDDSTATPVYAGVLDLGVTYQIRIVKTVLNVVTVYYRANSVGAWTLIHTGAPYTGFEGIQYIGQAYSTSNAALNGLVRLDSIWTDRTLAAPAPETTKLIYHGETIDPLAVSGGALARGTITCSGPYMNAGASIYLYVSQDGITWFQQAMSSGDDVTLQAAIFEVDMSSMFCKVTLFMPDDLENVGATLGISFV